MAYSTYYTSGFVAGLFMGEASDTGRLWQREHSNQGNKETGLP